MPRITCPACDQQLNVPDGARAVRCPACKGRIDLPSTPPPARTKAPAFAAEEDDAPPRPAPGWPRSARRDDEQALPPRRRPARPRDEDDEDDRPRRKKSARGGGSVRGVIPFVLFGPACLVLMAWAPFSGYGTALGMLVGALAIGVSIFGIVSRYFNDPVLRERVGNPDGHEAHLAIQADALAAAFVHPRRLAGWVAVEVLGFLVLVEAICTAAFLKTMEDGPPGYGPNPPGQQAGPGPAPPPAEKQLTDDEAVTKALTDLDSKEPGADWRALDQLTKVTPNPRRAEVLQKIVPLAQNENRTGATRTRAVKVLGAWGGPDEVAVLIDLIGGRDPGVREEAMRQIARFRDPRAIPVLVRWMADYDVAQKALAAIGPEAEPALIPFLGVQADFGKQGPALKVLKEVGTPRSVPYLQALVRLDDGIRSRAAQEALAAIAARTRQEPPQP